MSPRLRKLFITTGAVLSLLFFALFCLILAFLARHAWITGEEVFTFPRVGSLAATGCTALFSVAGAFGFRRLFRRTFALEIFFFLSFIISLSFDALKILSFYFTIIHMPAFYGVLVTRAVYLGFFLGLSFLFAGSLFSGELSYQKLGTALGLALVASLALVYSLPIDATDFQPTMLYRAGGENYILLVRFALEALTLLGFARSAFLVGSAQEWFICLAVLCMIVGRELIFFHTALPVIAVGFVLVAGGALLFGRKIYEKHQWI
ncbi:MAG: hypothetical protein FWG35_02385 [Spirochaetaceae bacterium]|nr:hypothetical protein [Spirochaetaceae bacterium]